MRGKYTSALGAAILWFTSAAAAADDSAFPRYPALEPAVGFWTSVFGEYSELQSAIHSSEHPGKVFEVLDFRPDAQRMSPVQLERHRQAAERQAKAHWAKVLERVHALRATPQKMDAEQRRVYAMYADVAGDQRFLRAADRLRAQRGLRERTGRALEIAHRYLDRMEATFAAYELPLTLTRLPIVESSFNVNAYSKVGASGLWQFMPTSAQMYMRLDDTIDDRSDPWTSTDGAARHLRDDYALLKSWPLALTAYNHGRSGVARALEAVEGETLMDLIERYDSPRWGFASRNFYAEFLAAVDVDRARARLFPELQPQQAMSFDTVQLEHYVPWETLQRLSGADAETFRALNPGYRPEVLSGQLYVPAGHSIRVPAGSAAVFQGGYAALGTDQRFAAQREYWVMHRVASGEVLGSIARRYGTSVSAIQQANGIRSAGFIRAGQTLKIPPGDASRAATAVAAAPMRPATHTVRPGQTLGGIARDYRVSVADLQRLNNLPRADRIRVGQTLKIPASG